MLEFLNESIEYWHWIIFGLFLSLCEIFAVSFVLLWFGLGAVMVGLVLLISNISITSQLFLWMFISSFNIYAWFKWVSPLFKTRSLSGMAREKMIGQVGTIIEFNTIHKSRGKLRFPAPVLGSDEWNFICDEPLEIGCRVVVKEFSGNSLIVGKLK